MVKDDDYYYYYCGDIDVTLAIVIYCKVDLRFSLMN